MRLLGVIPKPRSYVSSLNLRKSLSISGNILKLSRYHKAIILPPHDLSMMEGFVRSSAVRQVLRYIIGARGLQI